MDKFLEFTSNHVLLVSALMISFFLLIFTELRRKASGLVNVEASDAVKLINNDAVVVDIRSADAFARGHIVNAKNIPNDELDGKLEQLQQYKNTSIIAVCDTGITTTQIVNKLRAAGFETVFGLKGGMSGWGQAGLPVVTGKKTRSKSPKQKKRG
ncbi:MAG: rhodanese-like domain-containing protein [Gammaproteobacteria bacterium]|nr:rhodanese-like domain-containing protein [Gammaproteobacteria bacterium]MBU2676500.1 rhodanese-like domain-containing protein [Gammaproteobacteria bacterium]NNC56193.1 rhodanese-like domain-containing protein [Woeseiaceae bacterium]NNL50235.1 rhodanese-like domain-containing protein [Woeseiaceae bacterium]